MRSQPGSSATRITTIKPPHARWITIRKENNFTGKGDIIFTYLDFWLYNLFRRKTYILCYGTRNNTNLSARKPVPNKNRRLQRRNSLYIVGLSVLILPKIRTAKKRKTTKRRPMKNVIVHYNDVKSEINF